MTSSIPSLFLFFSQFFPHSPDLYSFPTRRSSDLRLPLRGFEPLSCTRLRAVHRVTASARRRHVIDRERLRRHEILIDLVIELGTVGVVERFPFRPCRVPGRVGRVGGDVELYPAARGETGGACVVPAAGRYAPLGLIFHTGIRRARRRRHHGRLRLQPVFPAWSGWRDARPYGRPGHRSHNYCPLLPTLPRPRASGTR